VNVFVAGIVTESENDLSEGSKDGERTPREESSTGFNNQMHTMDHLDDLELQVRT
jgi:hypothetical protein